MKDISAEARIFVYTGSMGRNDRKKKRVCPESVLKKYGAGYLTADLDPFAVSRVGFAPPDRLVLCLSGVCRRLQE